jgi:hypothetical protein
MNMTEMLGRCLKGTCEKVRKDGSTTYWYFGDEQIAWEVDLSKREGRVAVAKCLEAASAGDADDLVVGLIAATAYPQTILFDRRDS